MKGRFFNSFYMPGIAFWHIKTRRMNSPGLFQISAVLFLSGSAGNILKSAASFFFHPDCTVGSGFQPDQPPMAGRGLIRKGICRHGITAGRELHPTLKNVTFYVVADAASAAVFCYLLIIAENGPLSIARRAFFRQCRYNSAFCRIVTALPAFRQIRPLLTGRP